MKIRLGTRGSRLARIQSADVAARLTARGHDCEIVVIATTGDRVTDRGFSDVGPFGVFVREIESSLIDNRIDAAVHSYKDLPSLQHPGLAIAAVPERLDVADVLLIHPDAVADEIAGVPLRPGALVGTSASRRTALIKAARPDLAVALLRGNVPTRIAALVERRYDAIVLAAAGLARLEHAAAPGESVTAGMRMVRLEPSVFVPAPAQGAVAVQVRRTDTAVRDAVAAIDDARIAATIHAERTILGLAEAGCTLPFGAWCRDDAGTLHLFAVLGDEHGDIARAEATGAEPEAVASNAWQQLSHAVLRR
ncbi:MAG: hydroxymethylbilane synthase [Gemmatimonadales bacterium]